MRKTVFVALLISTLVSIGRTEPRWCAVSAVRSGKNLAYPPIARAARVYGVVLERVIYLPDGTVQSFERVSGPVLLVDSLDKQMVKWKLETSASGDAPCESLVIAEFHLDDGPGNPHSEPIDFSTPSMIRLKVTSIPLLISDPGGYLGHTTVLSRVALGVKRATMRLLGIKTKIQSSL